MEPRQITRFEAAKYARQAYDLGVRYIGGCCGFESYHTRAMAEELQTERGKLPEASRKSDHDLSILARLENNEHKDNIYVFKGRATKEHWMNMRPATGRPMSVALCQQPNPQVVLKSIFN